jgi:hypothetical protein
MTLGNEILAAPNMPITDEESLFKFLTLTLDNASAYEDKRKVMSSIFYGDTPAGVRIDFHDIAFNLTVIPEAADAHFQERFNYPFWSHNLGEYLCDLEARIDDLYDVKG